jgi:hypothetical protein
LYEGMLTTSSAVLIPEGLTSASNMSVKVRLP